MSSFHHRLGSGPVHAAGPAVEAAEANPAPPPRACPSARQGLRQRLARARALAADAGMATAEYAIATLAAVGFAGLLLTVLRSGEVRAMLAGIVKRALSVSG